MSEWFFERAFFRVFDNQELHAIISASNFYFLEIPMSQSLHRKNRQTLAQHAKLFVIKWEKNAQDSVGMRQSNLGPISHSESRWILMHECFRIAEKQFEGRISAGDKIERIKLRRDPRDYKMVALRFLFWENKSHSLIFFNATYQRMKHQIQYILQDTFK